MGKKVIHGGLIIRATLASGAGDDLLTIDSTTGEVGKISGTPLTTTLTAANIIVGNSSNVATAVAMSGDISITDAGVTAIGSGVIVNADVNASAAIAHSKMAALTASRALVSDGSGVVSISAVTSTQLGYLSTTTSDVQVQIDAKQATITGAATTITSSNLTASRALIANSSGKVAVSSVTDTELGYVSGVTSAIQTQLNAKFAATISSVAEGDILYYNGSAWVNLARGTNGQALYSTATTIQWDTPTINGIPIGGTDGQVLTKQSGTDFDADWETLTVASITDLTATAAELNVLDGITATTTELNYTDGVSSNIQTQLDGKQSSNLPQNAIWVGNSSNVAAALAGGTNGYVLTSVSGVPTWAAASAGSVPGSDTQVLFNDGGSFGADAGMVYDKTNDALTIGVARIFTVNKTIDDLFIGEGAGNFTTTGVGANIGIGKNTLTSLTNAVQNVAVGHTAGDSLTSGGGNTLIGHGAGEALTTATNNTIIGAGAGTSVTGSQNILIGYDIEAQTSSGSSQLSLANAIFGLDNSGTGTVLSTGTLGVYVAAPTASLDIIGSTTAKSSLRIRSGTAPTSPNDGDIWFDGTDLKIRIGGVTRTFTVT